jgi:hypothetical protein
MITAEPVADVVARLRARFPWDADVKAVLAELARAVEMGLEATKVAQAIVMQGPCPQCRARLAHRAKYMRAFRRARAKAKAVAAREAARATPGC